jgi:hypothetical protein
MLYYNWKKNITSLKMYSCFGLKGGEVMTTRCKACWLKLALTGFRMRECDHDDLRRLLPADMMDLVPTAANRLENLPWAPNRGQIIRMKSNSETKVR